MPYVVRDPAGRITEVHAARTEAAREELAPDDPALRGFFGQGGGSEVELGLVASDLELIRVVEDLIAALIEKRIIALTDLPKAAQQKLAQRYRLRTKLADLHGIVGETDEILLP
ncbi:MAG: hypothetical protein ACE5GS_08570 [Kiloniellaceae bacterium]